MNGKDLILGLKYVGDDLVEKAEYGQFPNRTEKTKQEESTRRVIRRPFLIAAVIAMVLLLGGCAVAYMLSLKEIKLGDQLVTYDDHGQETRQVLTLAGLGGTPASQAAREWYEFCESYDPDGAIRKAGWGNQPEFPAEYYGYGLYTQEMKEKLDEILTKYGLKLRGQQVEFQTSKLLLQALGMENALNPDSEAKMNISHAAYYENGALDLAFVITIPGEDGADPEKTDGYLHYRSKDCFIPDTAVLTDAEWEEWNYTTAAGDDVLIIRSEEAGSALILCDMENYTASVRLNVFRRLYEEKEDGVPVAKFVLMTKHQLEQVADAVDFSLEPKLIDGWEKLSDGAVPAGQEINGYRIEPVSAFTDGYGYQIVLRITAPEGVALTNPDDHTARIDPGAGATGHCEEDGDGKLNTCHYILSDYTGKYDQPDDGSFPYPEGYVIPVYWEDMYFSCYDFIKNESIETLLTEGTWKFDVPLNDADTRQIELLTRPITAKASVAWEMDGTDVLEELEITSIKLRSLGIELTCENKNADFFCIAGQSSYIVMKDGSRVEFIWRELDKPIDLEQAAYIQLADKTIIPMPGVDEETVKLILEMMPSEPEKVPAPVFEDGIELLTEPITMKHLAGYASDLTGYREPLYECLNITSIILHPSGLAIMGPAAFDSPDTQAAVVLKDGSEMLLTGMGGSPYCDEPMSQLEAEAAIDLSEVDHILLPDGTKLKMPGA